MNISQQFWSIKLSMLIYMPTIFSTTTIISVIIAGVTSFSAKLISVNQLFSVVPLLICENTGITVITVKTFEKTRVSQLVSKLHGGLIKSHQPMCL